MIGENERELGNAALCPFISYLFFFPCFSRFLLVQDICGIKIPRQIKRKLAFGCCEMNQGERCLKEMLVRDFRII